MPKFALSPSAAPADVPRDVRLQIVSSCAEPPSGDGWLHEIKHDGHRLVGCTGTTTRSTETSGVVPDPQR
jgi:hypothetical protein